MKEVFFREMAVDADEEGNELIKKIKKAGILKKKWKKRLRRRWYHHVGGAFPWTEGQ